MKFSLRLIPLALLTLLVAPAAWAASPDGGGDSDDGGSVAFFSPAPDFGDQDHCVTVTCDDGDKQIVCGDTDDEREQKAHDACEGN